MSKKVVITGANQRIGLFLCGYFLSLGYEIIAVVRVAKRELKTLKVLNHNKIEIIEKDFNRSTIDTLFWNCLSEHDIAGFIHCASTFKYDDVTNTNSDLLKEQQQVNCNVFIDACTSYCQSEHKGKTAPSFIAFLDAKLEQLNKDHYSYTLSKLQLKASIPFLAMSCAPHLRVNAISPGLTLKSGEQTQEQFEDAQASLPFGFGPNLEDIAQSTAFLLMMQSITGQIITVDAGQHLQSKKDIIFQ